MRLENFDCHFDVGGTWTFYLGRGPFELPLLYLAINHHHYRFELELFGVITLEVCQMHPDKYVPWNQDKEEVLRQRWERFYALPFVRWTFHFGRHSYWQYHTAIARSYANKPNVH